MWHLYCDLTRYWSVLDRDCAANACHDIEWDDHRWNGCAASSRQTEPNEVCLGVQYTGPGLSAKTLPRLFEPFYTTKPGGWGMGLAICRSIIEAHGGRMWATRCEPWGALFQFTIPAD